MRFVRLFMLAALLCAPAVAAADAKQAAKAFYEEGLKQYNLSHFEKALSSFESAYQSMPDAVFLFNIGQCHRLMGHTQEALHSYRAYLREAPGAPNRAEVERLRAELEQTLERQRHQQQVPPTGTLSPGSAQTADAAQLRITSEPPGALVRVDGPDVRPIGTTPLQTELVAPGAHTFYLSLDGYQTATATGTVAAGATADVKLTMTPLEATTVAATTPRDEPPRSRKKLYLIVGISVGVVVVAALGVGLGVGLSSKSAPSPTFAMPVNMWSNH
jgi:hypothetical protein